MLLATIVLHSYWVLTKLGNIREKRKFRISVNFKTGSYWQWVISLLYAVWYSCSCCCGFCCCCRLTWSVPLNRVYQTWLIVSSNLPLIPIRRYAKSTFTNKHDMTAFKSRRVLIVDFHTTLTEPELGKSKLVNGQAWSRRMIFGIRTLANYGNQAVFRDSISVGCHYRCRR